MPQSEFVTDYASDLAHVVRNVMGHLGRKELAAALKNTLKRSGQVTASAARTLLKQRIEGGSRLRDCVYVRVLGISTVAVSLVKYGQKGLYLNRYGKRELPVALFHEMSHEPRTTRGKYPRHKQSSRGALKTRPFMAEAQAKTETRAVNALIKKLDEEVIKRCAKYGR